MYVSDVYFQKLSHLLASLDIFHIDVHFERKDDKSNTIFWKISSFTFLIICMNYPKVFVETNIKFGVGEKEFVDRYYLHCCDGVKQAK